MPTIVTLCTVTQTLACTLDTSDQLSPNTLEWPVLPLSIDNARERILLRAGADLNQLWLVDLTSSKLTLLSETLSNSTVSNLGNFRPGTFADDGTIVFRQIGASGNEIVILSDDDRRSVFAGETFSVLDDRILIGGAETIEVDFATRSSRTLVSEASDVFGYSPYVLIRARDANGSNRVYDVRTRTLVAVSIVRLDELDEGGLIAVEPPPGVDWMLLYSETDFRESLKATQLISSQGATPLPGSWITFPSAAPSRTLCGTDDLSSYILTTDGELRDITDAIPPGHQISLAAPGGCLTREPLSGTQWTWLRPMERTGPASEIEREAFTATLVSFVASPRGFPTPDLAFAFGDRWLLMGADGVLELQQDASVGSPIGIFAFPDKEGLSLMGTNGIYDIDSETGTLSLDVEIAAEGAGRPLVLSTDGQRIVFYEELEDENTTNIRLLDLPSNTLSDLMTLERDREAYLAFWGLTSHVFVVACDAQQTQCRLEWSPY